MADYTNRIQRLLHIIMLVQGDRTYSPRRLAELFEMTERSVFRDMEDLRQAGVPIDFDQESGGYVIRRDFFLRPVDLSAEESLALCLLAQQVRHVEQLPHTQPALRAIEKIRATLPRLFLDELEATLPHVNVELARSEGAESSDVFHTVRSAIRNRRSLLCNYESLSRKGESQASYRFDPYALYFGQRAWYVVGKRHSDGAVRTLKLARFTRCTPTDTPYSIPGDFSLDRHLGNAWRMMRGETRYAITLHFSSVVAETVADTWWHASQQIDFHEDDSITARYEVDGLEEIIWWIFSYGPHCKVVEPKELRDRIASMAQDLCRQYAADT